MLMKPLRCFMQCFSACMYKIVRAIVKQTTLALRDAKLPSTAVLRKMMTGHFYDCRKRHRHCYEESRDKIRFPCGLRYLVKLKIQNFSMG